MARRLRRPRGGRGSELNGRLAGKVALISGAARGQGEAEARLFAREGASVVLGDIRAELGEQVAREVTRPAARRSSCELDVSSESDWARAVECAESTYGRLDILVNNAAIIGLEGIMDTSIELWSRVLAVNQTGTFLGMRAAIPAHAPRRRRLDRQHLVGAGDHGQRQFRVLHSHEGRRLGAHALGLGRARDREHPRQRGAPRRRRDAHGGRVPGRRCRAASGTRGAHPMGGSASPGRSRGVLFLASDEASFMTGTSLVIDGGTPVW